jgi:hypothetical protein
LDFTVHHGRTMRPANIRAGGTHQADCREPGFSKARSYEWVLHRLTRDLLCFLEKEGEINFVTRRLGNRVSRATIEPLPMCEAVLLLSCPTVPVQR